LVLTKFALAILQYLWAAIFARSSTLLADICTHNFFGFWVWVGFGYVTQTRYHTHPILSDNQPILKPIYPIFSDNQTILIPIYPIFSGNQPRPGTHLLNFLDKWVLGLGRLPDKIGWVWYRVWVTYPNPTQTQNPKKLWMRMSVINKKSF